MALNKRILEFLHAYPEVFAAYEKEDEEHVVQLGHGWYWVYDGEWHHEVRGRRPVSVLNAIRRVKPCECRSCQRTDHSSSYSHKVHKQMGYLPEAHVLVNIDAQLEKLDPSDD